MASFQNKHIKHKYIFFRYIISNNIVITIAKHFIDIASKWSMYIATLLVLY